MPSRVKRQASSYASRTRTNNHNIWILNHHSIVQGSGISVKHPQHKARIVVGSTRMNFPRRFRPLRGINRRKESVAVNFQIDLGEIDAVRLSAGTYRKFPRRQ